MSQKSLGIVALVLAAGLGIFGAPAKAQAPNASQNATLKARQNVRQNTKPNPTALQNAAQNVSPGAEPGVVRIPAQNLPQDPLQIAIQNAIQKAKQEPAPKPVTIQSTKNATGNATPNATSNATQNTPLSAGGTNNNAAAAGTLVCSGKRVNGAPFTFPFQPNTDPAPTLGAACAPAGKTMPKGTAVSGQANPAANVFAVVIGASAPSGGGGANNNTPAAETLVCSGTRLNGAAFTFPFQPNTDPAPTLGAACAPAGKTMPKGTAVTGQANSAAKVFAVVIGASAPSGGGGANNNAAAAETLVCSGKRVNGAPFTFPFQPNTDPAPTLGAACAPAGKTMPKGTAVMGKANPASQVFAVVVDASATNPMGKNKPPALRK